MGRCVRKYVMDLDKVVPYQPNIQHVSASQMMSSSDPRTYIFINLADSLKGSCGVVDWGFATIILSLGQFIQFLKIDL